jgi:hypothetical protein
MNQRSWLWKGRVRWLPVALQDARINRRWVTNGRRFLVAHHAARRPYFYGDFLRWLEATYPDLRALFELRVLPCRVRDGSNYLLHIPWLQDPLYDWSPRGYGQAVRVTEDCDRMGIPIVNRVTHHQHATKAEGARRIAEAGLRTPRMVPITDAASFRRNLCGLEPPLLVRETNGHGGRMQLVRSSSDAAQVPLELYRAPLAVQFIDVRQPRDDFCRRYRYFVAGDVGVPQGLHISEGWETRGRLRIFDQDSRREELAYTSSVNPHHAAFVEARRRLELDVVAFDYSYDRDGRMVVWEANPYPELSYPKHAARQYIRVMFERCYAAMLQLYLRRAGCEIPAGLCELASGQTSELAGAA